MFRGGERGQTSGEEALHSRADNRKTQRSGDSDWEGATVPQAARQIGVTEQTYYRWRKEYGGLRLDQAARLKALERENQRLKRIVSDRAVDISILKEAAEGNY